MRPFSISEQATFLFFLFYFNATFSFGVFRTSFGLLEAPVSEKTVTVSQVMHRWIGPADLDGFPGCNDMQRHATTLGPWTSRFFTTRLEITSIFLFLRWGTASLRSMFQLWYKEVWGIGGGGKGQECHWMFMHIDVGMACEGWCCHPSFQWSVNL